MLPTMATAAVGVLGLALLLAVLARHIRRFTRARAHLGEAIRTGMAQLRAIAYGRGRRHGPGVDSPNAT